MKHFLTCATLSGIALLFTQAHAESTSGHFQARLTLVATCSIEQASTTTMPSLAADVTCSKGSSYNLGRSHSRGTRTVKSATGSTNQYHYFPEHDHAFDWDNTSILSATGTGSKVTHTSDNTAKNGGEWTKLTLTY